MCRGAVCRFQAGGRRKDMQRYRSTHSYYFLRVWLLLFAVIWLAGLGIIFSVIRSNDSAVQELNMHYSRLMVDQTVDVKAFIQAFDDMGKLLTESGLFQQLSTASKDMVSKEQIDAAMEEAKGIYNWNSYPWYISQNKTKHLLWFSYLFVC